FAAPVTQVLRLDPAEQRMVRYSTKHFAKSVLGHAESQPLLQHPRSLFEDDDFQTVAHASQVRSRPVRGQRFLADNQCLEGRKIRVCLDAVKLRASSAEEFARLALRVEDRDLPTRLYRRRP